jgi:hypothetical protein
LTDQITSAITLRWVKASTARIFFGSIQSSTAGNVTRPSQDNAFGIALRRVPALSDHRNTQYPGRPVALFALLA